MTDSCRIPIMALNNVTVRYRQRQSFFRHTHIEALRNITFDVFRGETLGVIGRNGSGKSTLLRLLAGIYKPDSGHIERRCSKVSLQTVAAGFDSELSGRDNILISSMLLGLSKKEASQQMDSIVEFSELGRFIDMPLKTYSTGMRARLGFSIATELETDLLLIDEALSVGDVRFRKKAEKVMAEKINSEQTVVLVSHSIDQVKRTCNRAIYLDRGHLIAEGVSEEIVTMYKNQA